MIAAYLRVSSKSQDLKTQRDAIQRLCKARRERIDLVFEDRVSSRNERPQLNALREFIRGGQVRKLYVFRLDRLTRGGVCEMLNLMNEFRDHGCEVESIADGFGFQGPARDVVLAVIGMCAQLERAAITERVAAARARKEAAGEAWGRPTVISPEIGERIHAMRRHDYSIRRIAKKLGLVPSTVHLWLSRNPTPQTDFLLDEKFPAGNA